MIQVLDYSAGYPGAANIAARGYAGGMRYLPKEGTSEVKPLTANEVLDYRAHDLELGLIYQHVSRTRVLDGRTAGRHDAAWALNRANECGIVPRAIYFAVDFDTIGPQQWAAVREYMLGAAEIIGLARVGCYGEYDLLDYLFARASITWGWQTYAWSAGHNQDSQPRHPRAHLFQRRQTTTVGGIACDVNDVLKPDYGQTPAPEDTMPLTKDDIDAIAARIFDAQLTPPGLPDGETRTVRQLLQDIYGFGLRTQHAEQLAAQLAIDLAELKARPAADVDEAALAEELAKRGIDGVSAAELREILGSIRISAG